MDAWKCQRVSAGSEIRNPSPQIQPLDNLDPPRNAGGGDGGQSHLSSEESRRISDDRKNTCEDVCARAAEPRLQEIDATRAPMRPHKILRDRRGRAIPD